MRTLDVSSGHVRTAAATLGLSLGLATAVLSASTVTDHAVHPNNVDARVHVLHFRVTFSLSRANTPGVGRSVCMIMRLAGTGGSVPEGLSSTDRSGQVDDPIRVMVGWVFFAPLMWPVMIEVGLVAGKHRSEVPVTPDERQVQTLAAKTAHEPLCVTMRPPGARTGLMIVRAPIEANTASNAAVNVVSRSPMRM